MEIEIKKDGAGFKGQLDAFCNGLTVAMVALLSLDPLKVAALKKTRDLVLFIYGAQAEAQQYAQDMSKYWLLLFRGIDDEILGPVPELPVYPAVLPDVTVSNAHKQFSDFVQDCKRSPNFTSNVADGLGVLAPDTVFDPEAGTPEIKVTVPVGGHPRIHLKNKSEYQGMEIWKLVSSPETQPGGGTGIPGAPPVNSPAFRKLERVFGVNYTDPEALPAFGKAEVWHYKIKFLLKNEVVGNWTNVYSVTVTGGV
jgi:hypothetical protein